MTKHDFTAIIRRLKRTAGKRKGTTKEAWLAAARILEAAAKKAR
jgi:hypothetical protein